MLARRRPRTRQQMMGRRSRSRVPASRARGWRHLKFGSTERKSNAPDSATLVRHSVPFRKILAGAKILVWGRVRDLEPILMTTRSDERRVGKKGDSTDRLRGSQA